MGQDGKATAAMFKQVDTTGGFDISQDAVFKELGKYGFQSGRSTHGNRLETIQEALDRPAECPPAFKDIKSKPQRVENIDADVNQVKAFITAHLA
jgi:threonine synthase